MANMLQHAAKLQGIYAITDPNLLPGDKLLLAVSKALEGGIKLVQYRDKLSSSITRFHHAQNLLACCQDFGATLIINDDVDLCARIGANGVHLGQTDMSIHHARQLLGDTAIIGMTCHNSVNLAKIALKQSASYVALGRFHPSRTKASDFICDRPTLKRVKSGLNCPVAVIGGITLDSAQPLITDGADMIAICRGIFGAPDIQKQARALSELFNHTNRT